MKPTSNLFTALAILLLSFSAAGQTQPTTSDYELRLGIASYKNAQYDDAMRHFARALDLDGSKLKARLYLATTYMSQYVPGVDTPENIHRAEAAIEEYQHVLGADAELRPRVNSAKGIAYLYLNMKKFDDSRKYYRMASDLDPDDSEPYYSVGVIDWTKCYEPRMEARAVLGMRPEQLLDPRDPEQNKVCGELKAKNMPVIEEGMELQQGHSASPRLRRRHGLPELDVPRKSRRRMRRLDDPRRRHPYRRSLGRRDAAGQET